MKCIDEKYRYISETVKYTCIVRLHEIQSLFSILWQSKKPIKIYSGFRSYRTLLTLTFSNSLRTDIGLHIYYNLRSSKCINLSILHPVSVCWENIYQSEGQKHEARYWSSFVEEFLSTNQMQNFIFRLWTNYNNKKKCCTI